jgi:hypothetical protein
MPGVLKEFADLLRSGMKILAKDGKAVPLTSQKGGSSADDARLAHVSDVNRCSEDERT